MSIGKSLYYYSHTPPLGEGCARAKSSSNKQPPNKTNASIQPLQSTFPFREIYL
jgi:hypothetical protein